MRINEKQGICYCDTTSEIKKHMYDIVLLDDGSMHYLHHFLSKDVPMIEGTQMIKFEVPKDSIVLTNDTYQIGLEPYHEDTRDILIKISDVITQNKNYSD